MTRARTSKTRTSTERQPFVTLGQALGDVEEMTLAALAPRMAAASDRDWEAHDARCRATEEEIAASDERDRRRKRAADILAGTTQTDRAGVTQHDRTVAGAVTAASSSAFKLDAGIGQGAEVRRQIIAWRGHGITVLRGALGVGKSIVAMRWLLEHRAPSPVYLRANTVFGVQRSSHVGQAVERRWSSAGAMVLDDLGAEELDRDGAAKVALLEEILDSFAHARALLITTNITPVIDGVDQIRKRYGARVASRLRSAAWQTLEGPDLRVITARHTTPTRNP